MFRHLTKWHFPASGFVAFFWASIVPRDFATDVTMVLGVMPLEIAILTRANIPIGNTYCKIANKIKYINLYGYKLKYFLFDSLDLISKYYNT